MSRQKTIEEAERYFDEGGFFADLARRVAIPTESQNPDRAPDLARYLSAEMQPSLEKLGFRCRTLTHPIAKGPFLLAERIEDPALVTVFTYGHGDVIRGQEKSWRAGLDPWTLKREGDRLYGRGTADNKGQHTINLAALATALKVRGKLGFNVKMLIETGEEVGSPGLREVCLENKSLFAADVLIASDGPRLNPSQPTIFLGTRGAFNMDLTVDLRAGGHHSGNWGGLLANPGIILAQALASITGSKGEIKVPEWRPDTLTPAVREALSGLEVDGGEGAPEIDRDWGEPGLTPIERVIGWSSFEVLAFVCGDPAKPVNAIPPRASCHCQLRYVVGIDPHEIVPALERHLAAAGFPMVKVTPARDGYFAATRLEPTHPWVVWVKKSLEKTSGKPTAVLPNLGGSLPNDIFAHLLGLPTVWIPHSYASCSQHAPNEHMLAPIAREALGLMAGVMWDLGEANGLPVSHAARG
jgi:acetylornithine deacetylase/succinyl-diaminopimelate desuccinylase-like protein